MRWLRFAAFLLVACSTAFAWSQDREGIGLIVESNAPETYAQGSEHELWVRVRLVDPMETVDEGVLFLNVVENDEAGRHPQAMHLVFASAREPDGADSPPIFLVPLSGEVLRVGVETTIVVRLRARAPLGSYSMVIQLFEGTETHPHRVVVENRVAMRSLQFDVVP